MAENKDKVRNDQQQGSTMPDQGGIPSSAEANVFPAGAAQTSHGSADGRPLPPGAEAAPGDSAAGTPDEGKLGGAGGTSASGTTGNDPDR